VTAESKPADGPVGTLATALAHAERLLASAPQLAAEQATEILKVVPQHPAATVLLASARRRMGDAAAALQLLDAIVKAHPDWAVAHYEIGLARGALRQGEAAVAALRRAVELRPNLGDAWRALADHLHATGDTEAADAAYAQHLKFSTTDPRLLEAAMALVENRIAPAEALLRAHLKQFPTDIAAIRMLAEVAARIGRYLDAENLLSRCLELAPGFAAARHNYGMVLHRQNKPEAALAQVELLLAEEPRNPGYRNLKAAILGRIGEYSASIEHYRSVLADYPNQAKVWMSLGHSLKTAGNTAESVEAYLKSIEKAPELGEAYCKGNVLSCPEDVSLYLLSEAKIAVVGGESFGDKNCLRLSYATSENKLVEACKRMKEALSALN
jgi:tetratricopeptide (TPR) repeat protein